MHRAHHFKMWTVAALAAGIMTSAGCTLVGDNITGLALDAKKSEECIKACKEKREFDLAREQKRDAEERARCQGLSGSARTSCLTAENALHAANLQKIEDDKRACENACHGQGGGK